MRGHLQSLIDYTGLSIGEAAAICGIGHEALSRKLAGKARYDVRAEEIAALERVAAWQDAQVQAVLSRVKHLAAEHGAAPDDICMVQYRRNEDMLDPSGPPASAQRMIIARLMRELSGPTITPVVFDPIAYHDWRGGRVDTHALRGEWASIANFDYRLGVKLGGKYPHAPEKPGPEAIGWAVIQIKRGSTPTDAGEDFICA